MSRRDLRQVSCEKAITRNKSAQSKVRTPASPLCRSMMRPKFFHISDGKMGDVNVLDILPLEAGAFYVMDRGYLDFERLFSMHQAGAFFVTRA